MTTAGGRTLRVSRFSLGDLAGGGGLVFLVASATLGLSNFVFHVVISRLLGPDRYGALGALLTLVLVFGVPLTALQAAVTRAVAQRVDETTDVRRLVGRALVGGSVAAAVLMVVSPVLTGFLHLGSDVPVLMLAAFLLPTAVGAVMQGVLLGRLHFTSVGVALLAGGVARLVWGAALVKAGLGISGAMAAGVLGATVTLFIVAWPLRDELRTGSSGAPRLMGAGDGAAALLAVGGYWVLVGADTFLVRHDLAPHPAGLYAAAATGSRIALFAPAAFVMVVFPRFAAIRGRGPTALRLLALSLGVVTLMGVLIAGGILLLPGLLIHLLFGSGYAGSSSTVGILAVEAAVLGIIGLLTYFHLARGSLYAQTGWLGAAVAVVGISAFHRSLTEVATVMLVTSLVVLFVSGAGVLLSRDVVGQIPAPADGDLEESSHGPDAFVLSIIVPFYNPGPRFRAHLSEIVDVLTSSGRSFEIIAVSDGSTDGSQNQVTSIDPRIRLISLARNRGKGTALRVGMAEARGTYVGFIDADGDLPADLIPSLVVLAEQDGADVVLGSKRHPGSVVIYPPLRRAYSMVYQLLVLVLFHLPVRDTQTGLKLIRRQVMLDVVPRMVEKRFAFDLELLVVARRLGYRRFVEVPVVIGQRFSSTVSVRTVRGMVQDTLAIFYRLRIMHWYDHAPHPSRKWTAPAAARWGAPIAVPSLTPPEPTLGPLAKVPGRIVTPAFEFEPVAR